MDSFRLEFVFIFSSIIESNNGRPFQLSGTQIQDIQSLVNQSRSSLRAYRLQKYVYKYILSNVFPQSLCSLLDRRCLKYFALDSIGNWFEIFKTHPNFHHRSQLFRTVSGAWLTNRRLGQQSRQCVFGCSSSADELQHYCDCSPLMIAISRFLFGFI